MSRPGDTPASIEAVRDFWNAHPCDLIDAPAGDRQVPYREVEQVRYARQPHIVEMGRFDAFAGKRVLEIGCGLGTDGAQFAQNGADYTGVDLTDAAIQLARENFRLRGLPGEFRQANAESLPFAAETFDHVYSFGVLHHSVSPAAIVDEIYRVLRPGGTLTVMVYNRSSINYRLEIMFLRKLGRELLRPAWSPRLLSAMLRLPVDKLEGHRRRLLIHPHPTQEQWVSMNTDGPDCPLARVYSAQEARDLFAKFTPVQTTARFFDRSHWPWVGRLVPDGLARELGRRWGWHRLVMAAKPKRSA